MSASRAEREADIREACGGLLDSFGEAFVEAFLDSGDDQPDGPEHRLNPLPHPVILGGRLGSFAYRYVNHQIGVHLHIHAGDKPIYLEHRHLAFVFEKGIAPDAKMREGRRLRDREAGIRTGRPRADEVQRPVPVLPGPVVQDAEGAVGTEDHYLRPQAFNSVVRLYGFDDRPTLLREWPQLPSSILEIGGGRADRKLKLLVVGGRVLSGLQDGRPVDQAVESGAQLIKQLAELESKVAGEPMRWLDPQSPCPIILHAESGRVGFVFKKATPRLGQGFGVHLCPRDALPAVGEFSKRRQRQMSSLNQ